MKIEIDIPIFEVQYPLYFYQHHWNGFKDK